MKMNILLTILFIFNLIISTIQQSSPSYETPHTTSSTFLSSQSDVHRSKYEVSRENIETTRESCIDEYRLHKNYISRRQSLSPFCKQYCAETDDCIQDQEQPACNNPLFPPLPLRTMKFVRKIERMCYVRITEILRYDQAEQMCHRHGLQLAIIDNIQLLERLRQMDMFTVTCKGPCPEAKGYYIGLKRQSESKWIWSNNVTWTQNEIDCGNDYAHTSYADASLLCYIGEDGQKKVTVWNVGEPNDYRSADYRSGEQCVEVIAHTGKDKLSDQIGRLNDIPCIKPTLGVLCQIEDIKPANNARFKHFAMIIGFNETETSPTDPLGALLANFGGPIEPNLDAMAAMTAALEALLVLPSFTTGQATSVLNVVDQLVDVTGQVQVEDDSLKIVTNKLLHFLDRFPTKINAESVPLSNEPAPSTSFEFDNMNMSLINVDFAQWPEKNHGWLTIASENPNNEQNSIVELNIRAIQEQLSSSEDINQNYRIIETVFSNFNLFPQSNITNQTTSDADRLIGKPISYQIANWTMTNIENLIRIQIRVPPSAQSHIMSCVYWSFEENNGSWISDSSCRFDGYHDGYARCYCNHLTHFSLFMLPVSTQEGDMLTMTEDFVLTFVTYIGIVLSIFGLVITLITYGLFRRSHKNHMHISLIMLCISILFVNCLYLPFSLIKTNVSIINQNIICAIFGSLIHYFLLTSFMWMLIIAIVQYLNFVRIFNTHISHFFMKTLIIGWIIPLLFPLLVILIGPNAGYSSERSCWIHNRTLFYTTFLVPISTIALCNLILFVFVVKSIFHRETKLVHAQKNHAKLQISAAVCCFVSIGCTWLFGLLVLVRPIFIHQLIFCVFNSLQGFLIFLFHVYLSKPKRELWRSFFIERGLQPRQQMSSVNGQKTPMTKSNSSTGNDGSNGPQLPLTQVNPAFVNQTSTTDKSKQKRTSNRIVRTQREFISEQAQRHVEQRLKERMRSSHHK